MPVQTSLTDTFQALLSFEAMLQGDRQVDRYAVFRRIAEGVRNRERAFLGKPMQWMNATLSRWHREFRDFTYPEDLTDRDITQRLHILLTSDLGALEPTDPAAYRRHLLTSYRPYLT